MLSEDSRIEHIHLQIPFLERSVAQTVLRILPDASGGKRDPPWLKPALLRTKDLSLGRHIQSKGRLRVAGVSNNFCHFSK